MKICPLTKITVLLQQLSKLHFENLGQTLQLDIVIHSGLKCQTVPILQSQALERCDSLSCGNCMNMKTNMFFIYSRAGLAKDTGLTTDTGFSCIIELV